MAVTSEATTLWFGDLMSGKGTTSLDTSDAAEFPVSWAARSQGVAGKTNPEELIGAAHSACFSMRFSGILAEERHAAGEPAGDRGRHVPAGRGHHRQPPARQRQDRRHQRRGFRAARRGRQEDLPGVAGAERDSDHARSQPRVVAPERPTPPRDLRDRRQQRILISGASGFIGTELTRQLRADGHTVLKLVRRQPRAEDEVNWAPAAKVIDFRVLDSVDAVVNLSGASAGRIPWTAKYKRVLYGSRVTSTQALAEAMNMASQTARGVPQRVGGRLLRRPSGRTADRSVAEGHRVLLRPGRSLGAGGAACAGEDPRRHDALGHRGRPRRRRPGAARAADPAGPRRADRQRRSALAVDQPVRRGGGDPASAGVAPARAGEPGRSGAGDQRSGDRPAGEGDAPLAEAHAAGATGVDGHGRSRPGAAAVEPEGGSDAAARGRVRVPVPNRGRGDGARLVS